MKEPHKTSNGAKLKAGGPKRRQTVNGGLGAPDAVDELATMLRFIEDDLVSSLDDLGLQDPVELFSEYVEARRLGVQDEEEHNHLLAEVVDQLGALKLDANGGDRQAREGLEAIYDILEKAIEDGALRPIDLMVTAKVFADAGLMVPDHLKRTVGAALEAGTPFGASAEGVTAAEDQLTASILKAAEAVGNNPFDVHDHIRSLLSGLPAESLTQLLTQLLSCRHAVIDQAIAGFVLHPEKQLAESVLKALAMTATHDPIPSIAIERLVRMRPLLDPSRQAELDTTIRAMRLRALPPVNEDLPKVIKSYVSVCDGSGTRSLIVTQRAGTLYQVATVMMKVDGIADAMIIAELPKSAMDYLVRQWKSAVLTTETDLAGVSRALQLSIADNLRSGRMPPFKLFEVQEMLGLWLLHADQSSPEQIIAGLLTNLPLDDTNAAAVAKAHYDLASSELAEAWFEAGEALDEALYPIRGTKRRVAELMKAFLPERRGFWARQCAISALALRDAKTGPRSLWKQLALVGRDIASDMPIAQIPLMQKVAETSVQVFESTL